MRALNSAVTGLQAQQTAMDVIGNNIANVNTDGFKASRTDFSDLFYQTLQGGSDNTNASQVGYGVKVSGVSKDMSTTGETTTNVPTNLFINGEGYFIVSTDSASHTAGSTTNNSVPPATVADYYTRVGNFQKNASGYLVDANGNYVMGLDATTLAAYQATPATLPTLHAISLIGAVFHPTAAGASAANDVKVDANTNISDLTINSDGTISGTIGSTTGTFEYGVSTGANTSTTTYPPASYAQGNTATYNTDPIVVALSTFPNDGGLSQAGNTSFTQSVSSGSPTYIQASNGNSTTLISGALEQSNVDLAREFTNMIVTQRGFQANSRVITVADSLLEEIVNLKRS